MVLDIKCLKKQSPTMKQKRLMVLHIAEEGDVYENFLQKNIEK
jgi:hypothetical protein